MPEIQPVPGDQIEITISRDQDSPIIIIGEIVNRSPEGKWIIQVSGSPSLRGAISMNDYDWSYDLRRWTLKLKSLDKASPRIKVVT